MQTLRARGALLTLAVLLAILALPPAAGARPDMEIALQDDAVFVNRVHYDRELALRQTSELGITRLRVNVIWAHVTPAPGLWNFSAYDAIVDDAAAHNIRVQMTLTGHAPPWASGDGRTSNVRPDPHAYGVFAATVAEHFAGRVDRYSIWNEPNWHSWLLPGKDAPGIYRRLYISGHAAIKSVDPSAQVLIGETSPTGSPGRATPPLVFLRRAACVDRNFRRRPGCQPLVADGYAHHPYDFLRAPEQRDPRPNHATIGTLPRLTRTLDRLARARALRTPQGRALDLWLTEFGYRQSGKRSIPQGRRGAYTRRAFTIARRNPRVHQMLQYLLVAPPAAWRFFDTALLLRDGSPTPSWYALRAFAR